MVGMETPPESAYSAEHRRLLRPRLGLTAEVAPLALAAVLLLTAAGAQLLVAPQAGVGFSYLAVVCALGGISALLAAGMKV